MKLVLWILVAIVRADFGDLCRCSCDESRDELTILLPSSYACTTCTADACRHHFIDQCKEAVQIVTECLNRTSMKYKVSIDFYYGCLGVLFLLMFLIECFPRVSELLKIDRKREDDFDLADLPLGSAEEDDPPGLQTALVNLRRLETETTPTTRVSRDGSPSKATSDLDMEGSGDAWEPLIQRARHWS
eukprot:Gregarina_sp_Poly_1__4006@NODE_220_length_11254_cov_142_067489_g194_i0_p6_GENE_NODE_220_length_11254_cov_142_067489_g194_i0NODE_220_length_11254_cov_142_067489_g194_i0_p6_ORF_typecomplete_len188_score25_48LANC_like/PF05147_13/0_12zincribbons_6/PF07191_12/0_28_NODE_220_length_11254_cov_142_067489_g194_i058566419